MQNIVLLVAHVLTLAAATECVPGSGSCDEPTSMKVSMLQKKQISEHTHEGETVSSLEERKARIMAELESLDAQIATLDETAEEDELQEELDVTSKSDTAGYCSPDLIGRRRGDPNADGGRCACRRRNGVSSTGLYGCERSTMVYYGGSDADARRRETPRPPYYPPRRRSRPDYWSTWQGKNCYTDDSDGSWHGGSNIGGNFGPKPDEECKQQCVQNARSCSCVVVGQAGECFLREKCVYNACDSNNYYTTYSM